MAAVKARVDGTVRVAAIYSVGLHDVSRHMQQFMSLYPEARVQLECLHPHKVVEAVVRAARPTSGSCRIRRPTARSRSCRSASSRWRSCAIPSHRLARRRVVAPADLNGETFVAFDAGLTIRKAIDRALRQHNVRVNIVMEFDNIETIKQAIIIAAGVSDSARATPCRRRPRSARWPSCRSASPISCGRSGIIHRRQKPLTPTASRFIELLKDANEEPARVAARS